MVVDLLLTLAGIFLLLLVAFDVYSTVLHSSSRFGPIGERFNRAVWRAARAFAFRLSRTGRHKLLNIVGPLLMPLLVALFIVTLITAFTLLYLPRFPEEFTLDQSVSPEERFAATFYFSGITLTTAGYGDIVPATTSMRFVAMFESATGLALISLAVTYLLAVYRALEKKRAIALSLYHQAGQGADAAGYIAYHFLDGKFFGLRDSMRAATRDMQEIFEAHVEHPVIHYFHPVEVYKGLPRMVFLLLESCAIVRTLIDEDAYSDVRNSPEVRMLESNTRHVLEDLVKSLDLKIPTAETVSESACDDERLKRRCQLNLDELSEVGVRLRGDASVALGDYAASRGEWEPQLQLLAHYLGYDWEEITGDLDPEYASNEEKKAPARSE